MGSQVGVGGVEPGGANGGIWSGPLKLLLPALPLARTVPVLCALRCVSYRPGPGASPRSFDRGVGFIYTQTHLPPKFSFSSDFGHFILKMLENTEKMNKNY